MPDILPVLIGAGVGGAAAGTGVRLIARVHEAVTRCALDEPLQEGPAPAHRWPYPWTTRGERGLDRLPFVPAHIGLMMGGHSDPVCLRAEHFAVPRPSLRGRGSLRSPKHDAPLTRGWMAVFLSKGLRSHVAAWQERSRGG